MAVASNVGWRSIASRGVFWRSDFHCMPLFALRSSSSIAEADSADCDPPPSSSCEVDEADGGTVVSTRCSGLGGGGGLSFGIILDNLLSQSSCDEAVLLRLPTSRTMY